jgi:hypothetical protein
MHLSESFKRYQNWELALIEYNSGKVKEFSQELNISSARDYYVALGNYLNQIRRETKRKDTPGWALETATFLTRYVAMQDKLKENHPEVYNLKPSDIIGDTKEVKDNFATHKVKKGENLWMIVQRLNPESSDKKIQKLVGYTIEKNHLKNGTLRPGKILRDIPVVSQKTITQI